MNDKITTILSFKPLIAKYIGLYPPQVSAVHLSSLVMWQDYYDFYLEEIDDCLCVIAQSVDNPGKPAAFLYWAPLGLVTERVIDKIFKRLNGINSLTARIENIDDANSGYFNQHGLRLVKKCNEYIYRIQDIVDYQGNAYKSQRHDVNHLKKHHDIRIKIIDDNDKAACLSIFHQWATHKQQKFNKDVIALDMLESNSHAHEIALDYRAALGLHGILIEVDQKPAAYSLGYPLNHDTFVVLLEVAIPTITGLSAFTFNAMCSQPAWASYRYVNAMDDFGLPGVARAKELYHPINIKTVYNADQRLRTA